MAAEWFVFIRGTFSRMTEWEERTLEEAIDAGHDVVKYVWAWSQGGKVYQVPYSGLKAIFSD